MNVVIATVLVVRHRSVPDFLSARFLFRAYISLYTYLEIGYFYWY